MKPVLFQTKPALFLAAALGLVLFCTQTAPRTATAYDGLMSGSSAPSDGYDGLLAPSQPTRGNTRGTQEPPGYEGLIRGTVPQRPVETPDTDNDAAQPTRPSTAGTPPAGTTPAARPGARPVQTARPDLPMTPRPGRVKLGPISSAEQLMMLAALNGKRLDMNKIADGVKPSPAMFGLKDPKQQRIGGMLPMELMAKTQIEKVMASVNHPQLTPEQRQQNARSGYNMLLTYADGIMTRRAVPEAVYKKMGLSDTFLEEEREANERALARLEEAFKVLRPLQ